MSKPDKPGWPAAGAPFMPFPLPGSTSTAPPSMQDMTGGIDLIKDFWSRLPGGASLPGFMVPTVDVEELDKRIGDLKAAERWVEVNLSMLRTTIQGLEVQRHTIAAIQSLTTPATPSPASDAAANASTDLPPGWPMPAASAAPPAAPAAAGSSDWLAFLQTQFTNVAQAALTPTPPADGAGARAKAAVRKTAPRARRKAESR